MIDSSNIAIGLSIFGGLLVVGSLVGLKFAMAAVTETATALERYTEEMHDGETQPGSAPATLRSSAPGREFGIDA